MHKNLIFTLLCGALLLPASSPLIAQTEWAIEFGFDEMPSPNFSHQFRFSSPTEPVLVLLAAEASLDSIIQPTEPDLEKVKKTTHHLHFLIKTDPELAFFSKKCHDPLAIFRAAKHDSLVDEASLATVLSASLTAMGIPARIVFLQKKDNSDNPKVVVEAWINDSQRWAVCDAALDFVPGELGHAVSAAELLKNFRGKTRPYNMIVGSATSDKKFEKAVKPFLFGFCAPLDQRFLGETGGIAAPDSCLLLRSKKNGAASENGQGEKKARVFLTHSLADFYKKPD